MNKNTHTATDAGNAPREMTDDGHEVINGIIRSPGKFEGEPRYAPYFYNTYLDGCADADDGVVITFDVLGPDIDKFPELKNVSRVYMWESDQGFIYTRTEPFKF